MQKEADINEVDGIPVRSEEIGFSGDEMVSCTGCEKASPPNRFNCLYCGKPLELPAEIAAGLQFKPSTPEDWKHAISIVAMADMTRIDLDAIVASVSFPKDFFEAAARLMPPVPLLRVSADEADILVSRFTAAGLPVETIDERTLAAQEPPTRLKALDVGTEGVDLHLFNSPKTVSFDITDVRAVVVGAIFTTTSEATAKRKGKETHHVDEKFAASDHAVIDIYAGDHLMGYRIIPHGFDFSCLGTERSLLALENMKKLKKLLKVSFEMAVYDDSYTSKLQTLDAVWPRTVANTSKGLQRVGMKLQRFVGETVSNEEQFTRYSRMRRRLI